MTDVASDSEGLSRCMAIIDSVDDASIRELYARSYLYPLKTLDDAEIRDNIYRLGRSLWRLRTLAQVVERAMGQLRGGQHAREAGRRAKVDRQKAWCR